MKRLQLALLAMMIAGSAAAQGLDSLGLRKAPPASKADMAMSFAPIVKAAAPAVVNVYASQIGRAHV